MAQYDEKYRYDLVWLDLNKPDCTENEQDYFIEAVAKLCYSGFDEIIARQKALFNIINGVVIE